MCVDLRKGVTLRIFQNVANNFDAIVAMNSKLAIL